MELGVIAEEVDGAVVGDAEGVAEGPRRGSDVVAEEGEVSVLVDCRTAQAAGERGVADEGAGRIDGVGHEERAVCGNEVELSVGDDEETGRRWDHAGWMFFKGAVTGGDAIAADGDGGEGGGGAVGVKDVIVLTAAIYDEEITACVGVDEVFIARKERELSVVINRGAAGDAIGSDEVSGDLAIGTNELGDERAGGDGEGCEGAVVKDVAGGGILRNDGDVAGGIDADDVGSDAGAGAGNARQCLISLIFCKFMLIGGAGCAAMSSKMSIGT